MEERGVVIACAPGMARVRIERSGRCDGCPGCVAAGDGMSMIADAVDGLGVSPGDLVRIETRGAGPLSAAFLLFLLPLALLFAGYGAGAGIAAALGLAAHGQAAGAAGAVLFAFGSFGLLAIRRRRRSPAVSVIVEKLAGGRAAAQPAADRDMLEQR